MKILFLATMFFIILNTNCFAQTADELKLLSLANQDRVLRNIKPLSFNAQLYKAALFHSQDLADHGGNCDLHNSCDGTFWATRVTKYYPNWTALGENVATSISDPVTIHAGWMNSPGHRANILNAAFTEMGAAIVLGQTNFGKLAFATEDFGSRGAIPNVSPSASPTLSPMPSPTPRIDVMATANSVTTANVFKEVLTISCVAQKCMPVHLGLVKVSGPSKKKPEYRMVKAPITTSFSFNMKAEGGSVFNLSVDGMNKFIFTVPKVN